MSSVVRRAAAVAGCGALATWGVRRMARRHRRCSFRDAVVLITGGSRGLGLLLARRFGEEGARVALCARDQEELDRAASELQTRGFEVLTACCDVSKKSDVEQLIARVKERWGPVDVLVNNAGIIEVGPTDEMTLEDYEQAMGVHFWGPLFTSLAVLPAMKQRRRGRIVNIASIGGKLSVPHLLPYSSSKFALVGLSEGLRAAAMKDGIYVTTVCPGPMRTGSHINARFKGQHELEFAWFAIADSIPLMSIGGNRAADKIIDACRHGDAEAVLSIPAKVGSLVHGIAPGLVSDFFGLTDRWLPSPGGIGTRAVQGRHSRPEWLPHWITHLTDQAAGSNNEVSSH